LPGRKKLLGEAAVPETAAFLMEAIMSRKTFTDVSF